MRCRSPCHRAVATTTAGTWSSTASNLDHLVALRDHEGAWWLAERGAAFRFAEPSPAPDTRAAADPRQARAPVAGTVAQVAVAPGQAVAEGQPLVCVEAMKMEMWSTAAAAGTVRALHVAPKDTVAAGALLVELEIPQ